MRINHSLSSINAYNDYKSKTEGIEKSIKKMSAGLRIVEAGDDVAGLAISEKMRAQINGLNVGVKNAQDSINLLHTAEGALNETHSILQRMRELAVQSANDTNNNSDRKQIQEEVDALLNEIDRIANQTEFNTKVLMSGKFGKKNAKEEYGGDGQIKGSKNGLRFHIDANENQYVSIALDNMTAKSLGLLDKNNTREPVAVTNSNIARKTISNVELAIERVSAERAKFGAMYNRLNHSIEILMNKKENLQAAESRIRDLDMSKEYLNYTKDNIVKDSSRSMLAQANLNPNKVLELVK